MKLSINKSAKRVLSIAIAFAMFLGTMFVANVGVVIDADALDVSNLKIEYWEGGTDSTLEGSGTEADPYIISNAKEFNWVATVAGNATTTKYYKVDPSIDAFIMQSSATVTTLGGPAAFIDISSSEETRKLFEETAVSKGVTLQNWQANGAAIFNGDIDGSGVAVYGVYDNAAIKGHENCAFFPGLDGGGRDTDYTDIETDTEGNVIENLAIRNAYFKGFRRVGVITGTTWYQGDGTAKVLGCIALESCEISNCFLVGQDLKESNNTFYTTNNALNAEMGIIGGSCSHDLINVNNCLIYGNDCEYRDYDETDKTKYTVDATLSFNRAFASNGKNETSGLYGTITNSILVGTPITGLTNNFNEPYTVNNYTFFEVDTTKGSVGMKFASGLAWGTEWFAVEGQYPTPIKPDGWVELAMADTYFDGEGTKESPYIIRTTDQLYKMVSEQSYSSVGNHDWPDAATKDLPYYTSNYYKVADGVKAFYVNNVTTHDEVVALAESGNYNKWEPKDVTFSGNFDGNGATIYGMIAPYGFVYKMDGSDAAVKNVHFQACYATKTGSAAIVTTQVGSFGSSYVDGDGKTQWYNCDCVYTIENVSVTESYIKSTYGGFGGTGTSDNPYQAKATAAGLVALQTTPPMMRIINCLFDGYSSSLIDADAGKGANKDSAKAGIATMGAGGATNNWHIRDCISINEYPISMKSTPNCVGATSFDTTDDDGYVYRGYTRYKSGSNTTLSNVYGVYNDEISKTLATHLSEANAITTTAPTQEDIPLLDWANTWEMVEVSDDREIPMPTGIATDKSVSYSELVANYKNNTGANNGSGVKGNNGKYGWQYELRGSGTETDPYLITNALELAQTIGCGGKQYQQPLYYKLTCNIDLTGSTWINQKSINTNYIYVPFEGVLDGAGHVITGLSAIDTSAAGLVPVLNGGTIKNIHIRNSYAGSNNIAGLIAGQVNSGTITNCSVEGSIVAGTSSHITGSAATITNRITNSYYVADGEQTFYDENGTNNAPTALYPAADAQWYKGADGIYRQISFAKAGSIIDVDADGIINTAYTVNDVITLRKNLLDETGYLNIYGDVNNDGATNISDLVTIRRDMVGSRDDIRDGFWRSLELGKVSIYYAENDTYDMARKIEVYLEAINPTTDITKVAGTAVTDTSIETKADYANQQNAVVITQGTPTDDTYDDYSITYDAANNVLTFYGGSFTAVEQAVVEFIENADPRSENAEVYTTNGTKSILSLQDTTKDANSTTKHYLSYKTIEDMDGKVHTVYYAWGDEFEGTGLYDTDTWEIRNYRNEGSLSDVQPTDEAAGDTRYLNLEQPTTDSVADLWEVKNGKLKVWRGVNKGTGYDVSIYSTETQNAYNNGTYTWGYKDVAQNAGETNSFGRDIDSNDIFVDPGLIQTSRTMVFKQGYSEMRAALPSDGHAFPAWWFMTGVGNKSTETHEKYYLFSKVYKLNSAWDGVTMTMDPTNLSTYKYQMPQAFLEYDIVEFMQAQGNKSGSAGVSTGDYRDYIQLTIHKYYSQHVKDGKLYVPDWSTGGFVSGFNGITQSDFHTTSSDGDNATFIHRFDPDNTTSAHPYTVVDNYLFWQDETETSASYSVGEAIENGKLSSGAKVNDIYTYGFWWSVDEAAGTYDIVVYVDFNNDGNMAKSEMVFHINETNGHEYNDPTYDSATGDAAVWNQYAYMLIDNAFYTSNPYGSGRSTSNEKGVTMFTDLLTQESGDTTTFDIEYVRVYQEDGKRDIITPETEAFNTGNHFGY